MVYDRSEPYKRPIKSTDKLAPIGLLGGYADHKIELEQFWHSVKDVPWTILRPYHIVGAGSLLGCIPDENRNPKLVEKIKNNEPLVLCEGGQIPLNFIHPNDVAEIVMRVVNNEKAYFKAYNAVNPTVIMARDYFESIGKLLGKEIVIINKPIKEVWEQSEGWELTTLPHIYETSDLQSDLDFTPSISIDLALREAIEHYPNSEQQRKDFLVHQRMTLEPRPKPIPWLGKD